MADQCIVCLEPLDVEASANPAPLAPAEQQVLKDYHQRHATEDADALAKPNQESGSENSNHENVAKIEVCGHMLHDACLREWTEKANSCPICRQTFHTVTVYDRVGGKQLSIRKVEDKKQAPVVPEYDPREWMEELVEQPELPGRHCPVCNSAGDEEVLLLCDGCDAAYHTHCIDLDEVPRGPWFCMECEHALGPDVLQPIDNIPSRDGGFQGRSYYFPRTQASMRRARQRAQSDEWQGAWGRITGRVWDALELDLDYEDEEDPSVFESLQRSRQLREREREEHERWQQRLNIAARLGARDAFLNNMTRRVERPQPDPPTREERLAWGALEKARDMESRKRKSRSATAEPSEEPHHEPERKLKRPRTRRLPPTNGESSSSAARDAGPSDRQSRQAQQQGGSSSSQAPEAPPSFLSSLLKEVEMSTPSDEETLMQMFGPIPGVNDAPSPAHSHGAATPPPNRASSPVMTLSSHIAPLYASPSYTPTRGLSLDTAESSRSSSPKRTTARREAQSSPDNSDSEHRGRRPRQPVRHGPLELRQPQPRRTHNGDLPRSHNTSPARSSLPLELKESISKIVRGALKPHWRSKQLTAEQYETINRDISRKIYEEVKEPEISEDMQQAWERMATQEVARAVASLKA
ncbi:hypothetical protein MYCTH_2304831 [Thermothelomyces thermophilus ATCC 42464]|uniref:PHD and RING finger domain-containing protein n=1 Tax=Thermothelomyces thermophilus (strain ATCC 42464 / BCRC 31852 / DSM 1799) TaxID=573729 RepID=G2QBL8_THET4|nr:uncharacterized protein MYCTH_2304831 [Thermothelomyces thermophilus ATCC 42464]AEO57961.1 hypothetical protein MYCTH_2304831 [Thermothelomyces thermophilus ATCC 42464]